MINYEIITITKMWPNQIDFMLELQTIIRDRVSELGDKFAPYNFENHIFTLYDFLRLFYQYYRKTIMNIDNRSVSEKSYWTELFIVKLLDTIPSLYITSKLLTDKLLDMVGPEMGATIKSENRSGTNTSNFNFDMEENKFGFVSKNTNNSKTNDIGNILSNIVNWAYPSFIGAWLQSFRQLLFITTYVNGGD